MPRQVKRLCVLVAVVGLSLAQAQADTSSSHETKNSQLYGNCGVFTLVDMFTDEETHVFFCHEETLTAETQITIRSDSKDIGISLSKGLQFHTEPFISVAIRIDNGPLIKRDAYWDSTGAESAYILDKQLALSLLHDLARGQRVAIQVGDERGHIQLDGSQRAVEDFRRRAGLQSQQTLEIPTELRP